MNKDTISILKYIRDNQAHGASITKEEIARYMDENEICSRPTTLKLIQRLLDDKIISNDKKRDNTFSSLIINPSFDFRELASTMLKNDVKENLTFFDGFVFFDQPTEEQVGELHNYLDEAITEYYRRMGYKESDRDQSYRLPTKKQEKIKTKKGK